MQLRNQLAVKIVVEIVEGIFNFQVLFFVTWVGGLVYRGFWYCYLNFFVFRLGVQLYGGSGVQAVGFFLGFVLIRMRLRFLGRFVVWRLRILLELQFSRQQLRSSKFQLKVLFQRGGSSILFFFTVRMVFSVGTMWSMVFLGDFEFREKRYIFVFQLVWWSLQVKGQYLFQLGRERSQGQVIRI